MHTEIISTANQKIKDIKSLLAKKGRTEHRRFIAEGIKCVQEALLYVPMLLKTVLIDKNYLPAYENIIKQADMLGAEIYTVPQYVLQAVSDVKTPQGIAAVLALPEGRIENDAKFLVALDNMQDPANVGAIIRTADAAGADGVVLSLDSADPYSPKALRASMGSLFHIGIIKEDLKTALQRYKKEGFMLCAADLSGQEDLAFENRDKICLIIGNEANGINTGILDLCQRKIRIPIYGRAESLNAAVAAGILLYKISDFQRKDI